MSPNASGFRNRLLSSLSGPDRALLGPHLEKVELPRRKVLERADQPIEFVYFPEYGAASVVAKKGHQREEVEIGLIGYEGMTGWPVVLGNDRSPHATFIQIAGHGHSMPASLLQRLIKQSPSLQQQLLKYVHCFMVLAAETAAADALGTIEQRLARWLLMAQDRVGAPELPLTHEYLSFMLAVRRAGVTEALHSLEQRGLIHLERGAVAVANRDGLVQLANGLYGVPEREYDRLIVPFRPAALKYETT
jgi:CRP-like cAMP-binding protein